MIERVLHREGNATAVLTAAALAFCLIVTLLPIPAQQSPGRREARAPEARTDRARRGGPQPVPGTPKPRGRERTYPSPDEAWEVATIILGRPTANTITISVRPSTNLECYVEFGLGDDLHDQRSATRSLAAGMPLTWSLTGLEADCEYSYRLRYRSPGDSAFATGPVYRFHTQREPGSAFTFEVQGDSHPERSPKQNDPSLYAQTLLAAAKDSPDFYIAMGDDFSVDTLRVIDKASVEEVYLRQLPYLGLVAHSSALFLVNGNHEQAALCNLDGTPDNVAVWAQNARNLYFPQPAPDGFYTGDEQPVDHIGLLRDYYAWTWGDALFVVIDPYWHSPAPVDNQSGNDSKARESWDITVGEAQYNWLRNTLEESSATFKFVFAHHVNGTGRGGVETAVLHEWGGRNKRGEWEFGAMRPGWDAPIHELMVRNGVTIFFQGHDHIFARQEMDGVVYQTLPDPANAGYALNNGEAYRSGDLLPGSGRVRVGVGPRLVRVEYVRSWLPKDATAAHPDGEIAFAYEIPAQAAPESGRRIEEQP